MMVRAAHPLYPNEPSKQRKLAEAQKHGFIRIMSVQGVTNEALYELTTKGQMQWRLEQAR